MDLQGVVERISRVEAESLCREILQKPSVNGEASVVHKWVSERMAEAGFEVDSYKVVGCATGPLLLGKRIGRQQRPALMQEAHYDTVGGDPSKWSDNTMFSGKVSDGVIYGRGAVDGKCGLVSYLLAAKAVREAGVDLRGSLYFSSEPDGEFGMRGSELLAELGIGRKVDWIIGCEATSERFVETTFPGISNWKITAYGVAAHSTEPDKGVNAVSLMTRVVQAIDNGELTFSTSPEARMPTRVAVNGIRTPAGHGMVIPDICEAVLGVYSAPHLTIDDIQSTLDSFLAKLAAQDHNFKASARLISSVHPVLWMPGFVPDDSPVIRALSDSAKDLGGEPLATRPFMGGYQPSAMIMTRANTASLNGPPHAVVYGPGEFEEAHAANEKVRISAVVEVARVVAGAIVRLIT